MTVSISGQLPGEQANGLLSIEEEYVAIATPEPRVGVVLVERATHKYSDAKQEASAVIRFKQIELAGLDSDDEEALRGILTRLYAARTGNDYLPLDDLVDAEIVEEGDDE